MYFHSISGANTILKNKDCSGNNEEEAWSDTRQDGQEMPPCKGRKLEDKPLGYVSDTVVLVP